MTMLTTFAPPARQTVIRAGLLASEGGTSRLSDGYLLLALAESQPLTGPRSPAKTCSGACWPTPPANRPESCAAAASISAD
jgi:hypothetical protein